jgi:hypothetical protein
MRGREKPQGSRQKAAGKHRLALRYRDHKRRGPSVPSKLGASGMTILADGMTMGTGESLPEPWETLVHRILEGAPQAEL